MSHDQEAENVANQVLHLNTHTARWYKNSPTSWVLKETVKSGSAVLAYLNDARRCQSGGWEWRIAGVDPWWNWAGSKYAAQRAVREALRS